MNTAVAAAQLWSPTKCLQGTPNGDSEKNIPKALLCCILYLKYAKNVDNYRQ